MFAGIGKEAGDYNTNLVQITVETLEMPSSLVSAHLAAWLPLNHSAPFRLLGTLLVSSRTNSPARPPDASGRNLTDLTGQPNFCLSMPSWLLGTSASGIQWPRLRRTVRRVPKMRYVPTTCQQEGCHRTARRARSENGGT